MENISTKAIFNLQRFSILQTKLNPATSDLISDSYAYAWYHCVYPYLHDSDIHFTLKDNFDVNEDKVKIIAELADQNWLDKKNITFYKYENMFNYDEKYKSIGIGRVELLVSFRYFYLQGIFDEDFWKKLLEAGEYPIEASSITKEFNPTDLYLI